MEDNDRFIAGCFGIDVRIWKRVRRKLTAEGLLYECYDGSPMISSPIADAVILDSLRRYKAAVSAGEASGRSRVQRQEAGDVGRACSGANPDIKDRYRPSDGHNSSRINEFTRTLVENSVQRETDTKTKKKGFQSEALSVGDVIRKSELPAVRDSIRSARRLDPDNGR